MRQDRFLQKCELNCLGYINSYAMGSMGQVKYLLQLCMLRPWSGLQNESYGISKRRKQQKTGVVLLLMHPVRKMRYPGKMNLWRQ